MDDRAVSGRTCGDGCDRAVASSAWAGGSEPQAPNGTIWVANRGADTIRGFDARTGEVVHTWPMAPGSQPGDLAEARGKLYVSEEFGAAPALAVVDPQSGTVLQRFSVGITARPHHVHVSRGGRLVAFGLYGTDTVGVVDTRTDTLLGPWDTNPDTTNGRAHAGVFSPDGRTLYVTSDATSELIALDPRTGELVWRLSVPNAHELVITRNGKIAYVSARTGNAIRIVDLKRQLVIASFPLGPAPDTLQLAEKGKLLTVGLRGSPAQVAFVDTKRSSPSLSGSARCSTRRRSQAINGRHAMGASPSPLTKGAQIPALRSSTTRPVTKSSRRSATPGDHTESPSPTTSGPASKGSFARAERAELSSRRS